MVCIYNACKCLGRFFGPPGVKCTPDHINDAMVMWLLLVVSMFLCEESIGCVFMDVQIVTSSYTDLQDYTYYFVPAPWLAVKLIHLMQNYPPSGLES